MYLVDTNIYLEILLAQNLKEKCKSFLNDNAYNLFLSDFSFHSIGVILFRFNKKEIFKEFHNDIINKVEITNLKNYNYLLANFAKHPLDFDDLYQYCVAKENNLKLVTMDKDFKNIYDIEVLFIN